MIGLFYYRHFCHDFSLESFFLLLVSPLMDVFYREPAIVKHIGGRGACVVVDIEAPLQEVQVLTRHPLVVDVVRASLDASIQVFVS